MNIRITHQFQLYGTAAFTCDDLADYDLLFTNLNVAQFPDAITL